MKNSRKAAHLLAGTIMTAATLIGGAEVADAKMTASEEPKATESVVFNYAKIEWTYTPQAHDSASDGFVKITDLDGETTSRAVEAYYKVTIRSAGN